MVRSKAGCWVVEMVEMMDEQLVELLDAWMVDMMVVEKAIQLAVL